MKLIFEKSVPGRCCALLPACDVPVRPLESRFARKDPPRLPELSEVDLSRHYTALAGRVHGVNDGFYPLGSCTMKYNPALHEELAALPGFAGVHPLQPRHTVQGCLEVLARAEALLCEVTGMEQMTFQPAAGAHGELTGLLLIKAYHRDKGDAARTKICLLYTSPAARCLCCRPSRPRIWPGCCGGPSLIRTALAAGRWRSGTTSCR